MKRLLITIVLLALLGGAGYFAWQKYGTATQTSPQYRTVDVRQSDVIASISATGTIVPEDTIDVGAQVNGQIASFGTGVDGKPLDYRSEVAEGALLATIDDSLYAADVSTAEAQLTQAEAQIRLGEANRQQARARLFQAEQDWGRAQKLGVSEALAQADYDALKSAYEQALAAVAVAEAQIGQAHAQVAIANASVTRARRNLAFCKITSPVSGVIIDKRVDVGQTVVASLNAPSLFLIAKDLRKMLVLVQVNEADIGGVEPGKPVTFAVDAVPGRTFQGTVRKVRLNATMTQNVVTYTVEISTNNPDLKLLPYLTANVTFVTGRRENVLTVPNAALRFVPAGASADAAAGRGGGDRGGDRSSSKNDAARSDGAKSEVGKTDASKDAENKPTNELASSETGDTAKAQGGRASGGGRPEGGRSEGGRPGRRESAGSRGRVWTLDAAGQLKAIRVTTGLSDGSITEVQSDEITEGMSIVVGDLSAASRGGGGGANNPFAPQMMRRR